MRAAIKRGERIVVDEIDMPEPGAGQVLVRTLHCGICGSDLHALHHCREMAEAGRRTGLPTASMDPGRDLVFGHEFCAEIVDFGPGTERKLKPGTAVCALAATFDAEGPQAVGFSHRYPGGFAEYMVLTEALLFPVTNGVASEIASMVEPMAVGVHAVAKADREHSAYLVIGCGPVGLAVIAELKALGLGPVVASDPVPERRSVAEQLGADIVVDPNEADPHERWGELGVGGGVFDFTSGEAAPRRAVIFECVGSKGMLNAVIDAAPVGAQIVVAGICMVPDMIEPVIAMNKELELRFVMAYSGEEFARTVQRVCEGELQVEPIISRVIGLDAVPAAFESLLADPREAKLIVAPAG